MMYPGTYSGAGPGQQQDLAHALEGWRGALEEETLAARWVRCVSSEHHRIRRPHALLCTVYTLHTCIR